MRWLGWAGMALTHEWVKVALRFKIYVRGEAWEAVERLYEAVGMAKCGGGVCQEMKALNVEG